MKDPFHSSKGLVNHAERRISELKGIIDAFIKTKPCELVAELNRKSTQKIVKIKLLKQPPGTIPGIVFDVLNALRSSLDHAGYASAIANGKNGSRAHFPFGDTIKGIRRSSRGVSRNGKERSCNQIPKTIFNIMLKAKPYKRGNWHLWALNKFCNSNKHELVTPLAVGAGQTSFSARGGTQKVRLYRNPTWNRLKNERKFARIDPVAELGRHYNITARVVFDEVPLEYYGVIPTLERMAGIVKEIIFRIETEAFRVGLFK